MSTTSRLFSLTQLPYVPPGANPFVVYRQTLHDKLYLTPTNGFNARMAVFLFAIAYGILVSIAYLVLTILDYRRRQKRLWVWRLVRRPPGRYIVSNQNVLFSLCSIVTLTLLLGYVWSITEIYLRDGSQSMTHYWRTLVRVPIIVHLWFASWANLQAAVLASQKATKNHLVSPYVANASYVGIIAALVAALLAIDLVTSALWAKAMALYQAVDKALEMAEPSWNGQAPNGQIIALFAPAYRSLGVKISHFSTGRRVVRALYITASLILLFVNVGGLTLVWTLRKQIKFNVERYRQSGNTSAIRSNQVPVPVTIDLAGPKPAMLRTSTKVNFFINAVSSKLDDKDAEQQAGVTTSQLKQVVHAKTAQSDQAKQILALKKVHWDMVVFSIATIAFSLALLGVSLWVVIVPDATLTKFGNLEMNVLFIPIVYTAIVDLAATFLVVNGLRHLASGRKVTSVSLALSRVGAPEVSGSFGTDGLSSSGNTTSHIDTSAGDDVSPRGSPNTTTPTPAMLRNKRLSVVGGGGFVGHGRTQSNGGRFVNVQVDRETVVEVSLADHLPARPSMMRNSSSGASGTPRRETGGV